MAKHLSLINDKKIVKKVSKKNFSLAQGHGRKVETLLIKLIEEGKSNSIKGTATDLERAIGKAACKRLADYLENYREEHFDGVGGVC